MTNALRIEKNIKYNHKKIYRLMRENGYLSVVKRKKNYEKPGKPHPKHNVLKRNFTTSCPYDKVATDVTEISMFGKKLYISPIKDLHTNMIESKEIGEHATLVTVMKMLEKVKDKSIPEGTIFHSDQGSIYNSLIFQKELEENNFIQSMSRKGTPIDNSPMESFFSTLKSEVIYNPLVKIENYEELVKEVEEYFEYYNNKRIQKGLGYLTPKQFKEKELARISMENVEN
jgi:transposase InsO family protein